MFDIELLEKLAELRARGLITVEEFALEKARLLNGPIGPTVVPAGVSQVGHEIGDRSWLDDDLASRRRRRVLLSALGTCLLFGSGYFLYAGRPHQTDVVATAQPSSSREGDSQLPANSPQASSSTTTLEEDLHNDPAALPAMCMVTQNFFVSGDGMRLMMMYAPDMANSFGGRITRMANNYMELRRALSSSYPNVDWDQRAAVFNQKAPGLINSRKQLISYAGIAWNCAG